MVKMSKADRISFNMELTFGKILPEDVLMLKKLYFEIRHILTSNYRKQTNYGYFHEILEKLDDYEIKEEYYRQASMMIKKIYDRKISKDERMKKCLRIIK